MTFDELVTEVKDQLNLRSADSTTRIGRSINSRYKRVTSAVGLRTSRQAINVVANTSIGSYNVVFDGIVKVERIIDDRSGGIKVLREITLDALREKNGRLDDRPLEYAIELMGPNSVTVRLDSLAQTVYALRADGLSTADTLSGSMVPQFDEDFHDVLIYGALADEYRKSEKLQLYRDQESLFEKRLSDLRMFIAKSGYLDIRQNEVPSRFGAPIGGGGGGSAPSGGLNYIQTGLITFDRDPLAPFAVEPGSAVVPNLDADLLDGQEGSFYSDTSNLTAPGSDQQVMFNDGGVCGSDGGLKYDKTNDVLWVTGALKAGPAVAQTGEIRLPTSGLVKGRNLANSLDLTLIGTNSSDDVLLGDTTQPIVVQSGQMQFPAVQNASSNVNTLDDYEEGTWTPALSAASGSGITYTTNAGNYIKVGKKVSVTAAIQINSLGTASGALTLTGLPFTVGATGNIYWYGNVSMWVTGTALIAIMIVPVQSSTTATLNAATAATNNHTAAFTAAQLGAGGILRFTFEYEADN